ncbi:HPF/RaiA family ribosome-associated protein, partial [Patescibacteria group bacterium]|nr:HPF/RaiA family ribosome-associated protein [Patescibacteria group bacterium]
MQINYFFKNLDPNEKKWCEEYVETKIPQLEKLIHRHVEDSAALRVKAEKFSSKSAYKITFDLKLPKQSFLVSEDDHTIMEAIDLAKDKLIAQL